MGIDSGEISSKTKRNPKYHHDLLSVTGTRTQCLQTKRETIQAPEECQIIEAFPKHVDETEELRGTLMTMARHLLEEYNHRILRCKMRSPGNYFYTRSPHKIIRVGTPYRRTLGNVANLSHLRIIESSVEGKEDKRSGRDWKWALISYNRRGPSHRVHKIGPQRDRTTREDHRHQIEIS